MKFDLNMHFDFISKYIFYENLVSCFEIPGSGPCLVPFLRTLLLMLPYNRKIRKGENFPNFFYLEI